MHGLAFGQLLVSALVINCSGLGARTLAHDESVYPVRGQILRIPKQAGIQSLAYDADIKRLTYIVERSHDIILGSTAYAHIDNTQPDPADTQAIRERTTAMQPHLADAPILGTKVGLRPARPFIRLEREPGTNIIHNYGHGGSGYTVSWGCAGEVVGG